MIDADELVEKKQKLFKRVFGAKYSLSLLEMQVSQKDDTRILLSVAFLFGELMTALDIQVVCEKIAKWLGGSSCRQGRARSALGARWRTAAGRRACSPPVSYIGSPASCCSSRPQKHPRPMSSACPPAAVGSVCLS